VEADLGARYFDGLDYTVVLPDPASVCAAVADADVTSG
jgi:hypothetical protein